MGIYDDWTAQRKKNDDAKATRRKDKIARGLDIKNHLAKEKAVEINSEEYREGWERIFGKKSTGVNVSESGKA